MGLRFSKRLKILPGVTLNLSKSGVSTSLGPRGAKVTLGHGKTRTTVGIPGTGLSHTRVSNRSERSDATGAANIIGNIIWIAALAALAYVFFGLGFWTLLF